MSVFLAVPGTGRRWYLYPQNLKADTYYGQSNNLVRKIYAYDFIQRILKQAEAFKIFKNANCYDGSKKNTDLAKYLIKLGFHGIYQKFNQHNWIHSNGFMVRIKRIDNGQAQFTIGITFDNPINWNSDGTPHSLKKYNNSNALADAIAFDENNEILKLAYDGQAIFVIPAFRSRDWLPYWFNHQQIDIMMKCAHLSLNSFGIKIRECCYDTTKLEKLLTKLV
jgi:hypothetical protein